MMLRAPVALTASRTSGWRGTGDSPPAAQGAVKGWANAINPGAWRRHVVCQSNQAGRLCVESSVDLLDGDRLRFEGQVVRSYDSRRTEGGFGTSQGRCCQRSDRNAARTSLANSGRSARPRSLVVIAGLAYASPTHGRAA
jgi:hypothetical protein